MITKRQFVKSLSLVLSGALALSVSVAAFAQDDDPLDVGVAVAQTSNIALFGQEQVIGAELARDYFNELGGVDGRPVTLILQDTGGDEAGAVNAFQALINNPEVVGIVGPTLSQQAFAADPLAEQAGVPVIAPSNTARGIPEIGEFIARISAPVTVVAPNAVKQALQINPDIENVAVMFAQNDAFSQSETQVFQQTVQDLGLNLATVQTFQTTDTDFTTQATNALAVDPDLIVISGLAADGGNLVRQLRELGYEGLIVGGNGFNTPNIFPVCQALCDGIIVAQAYSPSLESEINSTFVELYEESQGKVPGQFAAQAFTATQVFIEALQALAAEVDLASLSPEELRARLNEQILAGEYDTPIGPITFTPEGEIQQGQFYVAQVDMSEDGQAGEFVLIETVEAEPLEAEATPEATAAG